MSYSVEWTVDALRQLAAVWVAAPDRNAVTAASHRLDQLLKRNPLALGESRDSTANRTAFEPPLGIEFEVVEDDKKVRVIRVWSTS